MVSHDSAIRILGKSDKSKWCAGECYCGKEKRKYGLVSVRCYMLNIGCGSCFIVDKGGATEENSANQKQHFSP